MLKHKDLIDFMKNPFDLFTNWYELACETEINDPTAIYIKNDSVGYNNPIKYTKFPLISGYISKENLISIKNSRPFYTTKYGKGRVSVFTDNTNFRAFWYGTNKLMMNAIFFADMM